MNKKLLFLLVLLLTAATGAWATDYTTLAVGDVIKVGDTFSPTADGAFNDYGVVFGKTYTLMRADVDNEYNVTEKTDGAYYVFKYASIMSSPYIHFEKDFAVTAISDGLVVTKIEDIKGMQNYTLAVHEPAAASGYTVSLKDGTQDAGKWTVKAGTDGSFQSLPLKGVTAGTKVKLKYDGDRSMLKGVKATSDAKKEPATVTTAPTGAEIVGVGKETALVSGGVADGGTLMYQMTTTNTKPTSTDGFSATVPTAQTITASGKVYVWYFVKADDTHSDSEIAGPVSVTLVEELTWNTTNVFNSSHQKDKLSFNKKTPLVYEGITISYSGDDPASHFYLYYAKEGKGRLQCYGQNGVKFTFTAPSGKKFVRIEMTDDDSVISGDANWIVIEAENKLVWSGTPSNTVEIAGDNLTKLTTLNTIVFNLVDAE